MKRDRNWQVERDRGRRKGIWEIRRQRQGAQYWPGHGLRMALASQLWEFNQKAGEKGAEDGLEMWAGTAPENLGVMTLVQKGPWSPSP